MFRALFWKEWRQLSLVRWGGVAIGALLPVAFLAGAEMATRGWMPTGTLDRYSINDLMFDVLPMALGLVLWPLMALMLAAQAFAGERSAGTESFLLERPVPRTTIWATRLLASLTSLIVIVAATASIGGAGALAAGTRPIGWSHWIEALAAESALASLGFLGGVIASSLLAVPLGAVLGGAILGALPVIFGAELGSAFPHARIGAVPIGAALPLLMLPAYVAASWAAACLGEPAGRGRVKRGLSISGASVLVVLLLFVVAAPVTVRARVGSGMQAVMPSASGRSAFVGAAGERWGEGGWLVDVASGSKLAFIAPPMRAVAWNADGSKVAIVSWSAPLGGEDRAPRIEIRRADTGAVDRAIHLTPDEPIYDIAWAGDDIVALSYRKGRPGRRGFGVSLIDAKTGALRTIDTSSFGDSTWATLTPTRSDRRIYLRMPSDIADEEADGRRRGYQLQLIDVRQGRIEAPVSDAAGRPVRFGGWGAGLSPSGRWGTTIPSASAPGTIQIVEIGHGAVRSPEAVPNGAVWVADDRIAWIEEHDGNARLLEAMPGTAPAVLHEWTHTKASIAPSPDGRSLLVVAGAASARELGVIRADGGWVELPSPSVGGKKVFATWAGPNTLARIGQDVVYFEDIGKPGVKRFVLGSEADLR